MSAGSPPPGCTVPSGRMKKRSAGKGGLRTSMLAPAKGARRARAQILRREQMVQRQ